MTDFTVTHSGFLLPGLGGKIPCQTYRTGLSSPTMNRVRYRLWGGAIALFERTRNIDWTDLLILVALGGVLFGVIALGREFTGELRPAVNIDLSPLALPRYAFFSLCRGLIAYLISLVFTLLY